MVRISIKYNNAPATAYELDTALPFEQCLGIMRTVFKCPPDPEGKRLEYVLQYDGIPAYFINAFLNSEDLQDVPSGTVFKLRVHPKHAVEQLIEGLKDNNPAVRKKLVFQLKNDLQDEDITYEFRKQNGANFLRSVVLESTASTLAYALNAYDLALRASDEWHNIDEQMLDYIASQIPNSNLSVSRAALEVAVDMISYVQPEETSEEDAEKHANGQGNVVAVEVVTKMTKEQETRYQKVKTAVEKIEKGYGALVNLLSAKDLSVQTFSLQLINSILGQASPSVRMQVFAELDTLGINKILLQQMSVEDVPFKRQILQFQMHRMTHIQARKSIPYDANNPEHEAMLTTLWTTVFPDKKLEARISKQWGQLGFQGKDPASDFRGLGIFGLENIIYFCKHHTETFTQIVRGQASKTDGTDYPCAIAFINITNMLLSLLTYNEATLAKAMENPNDEALKFCILFDKEHAFEEMYCITCQVLDRMWSAMNATYMEFGDVMKRVTKQISDVLASKAMTLENFGKMSFMLAHVQKNGQVTEEENELSDDVSQALKPEVEKEMRKVIGEQRVKVMRDGTWFGVFKQSKQARYCRLSSDRREIQVGIPQANTGEQVESDSRVIGNDGVIGGIERTVPLRFITNLVIGSDCAIGKEHIANAKVNKKGVDDGITDVELVVTLELSDNYKEVTNNEPLLHLICMSKADVVHWIDGIKYLLDQPFKFEESESCLKDLTDIEMRLRKIERDKPAPPPPPVPLSEDLLSKCSLLK